MNKIRIETRGEDKFKRYKVWKEETRWDEKNEETSKNIKRKIEKKGGGEKIGMKERRGEEKVISNIEETWRQDGKRKQSGQNKRRWEEEMRRDKKKWEEKRWGMMEVDEIDETEMRRQEMRHEETRPEAHWWSVLLSLLHCYVSQHTEALSYKHSGAALELRWSMLWMQWQQKISLQENIQATVLESAFLISIKSSSPLQSPPCDECAGHFRLRCTSEDKPAGLIRPSSPVQPHDHENHD